MAYDSDPRIMVAIFSIEDIDIQLLGGLPYNGILNDNVTEEQSKNLQTGIYYAYTAYTSNVGLSSEGMYIVIQPFGKLSGKNPVTFHLFLKYDGTIFKWRLLNWTNRTWTSWIDV